jgi:hypothetical protein
MVDLNGDVQYSEIKQVRKNAGKNELFVYPNPVTSGKITLIGLPAQPVNIKIYDSFGRLSQQVNSTTNGRVDVSSLPAGKYVLIATSATAQQTAFFVR